MAISILGVSGCSESGCGNKQPPNLSDLAPPACIPHPSRVSDLGGRGIMEALPSCSGTHGIYVFLGLPPSVL